jgi:hypothetical protein
MNMKPVAAGLHGGTFAAEDISKFVSVAGSPPPSPALTTWVIVESRGGTGPAGSTIPDRRDRQNQTGLLLPLVAGVVRVLCSGRHDIVLTQSLSKAATLTELRTKRPRACRAPADRPFRRKQHGTLTARVMNDVEHPRSSRIGVDPVRRRPAASFIALIALFIISPVLTAVALPILPYGLRSRRAS